MNQLYISTCPETAQKFLCEHGEDNNIAEIFEHEDKVQALIDAYEFCKFFRDQFEAGADFDEAFLRKLARKAHSAVSKGEKL